MLIQFSDNIARVQRNHGLTQTALSEKLGVSRRTVGRILDKSLWKDDFYTPSEATITKVAQFFKLPVETVEKRLPAYVVKAVL